MLFNSIEFILVFLPTVWFGFVLFARFGNLATLLWLAAASYIFYGSWDWRYTSLLALSTLVNFMVGKRVLYGGRWAGAWCGAGIVFDLFCLAIFKYADFFVENFNLITGTHFSLPGLTLPPGISFFTFTQIAFLVDARRKQVTHQCELVSYALFVNWFPHLIAGPVLHHARMIPQFQRLHGKVRDDDNLASGLTLFSIGIGKKLLIADPLSLLASPVFDSVASGMEPSFRIAWFAAVGFAFQIYFDFSGYSDMARGLSRMFNVELPLNFASPYKSQSIIDFWRRWHISLSSFLRDYLYIPMGGSRKGAVRRYGNLMITMLCGGLWHGASWGFVLWGGLHGLGLVLNHLWRSSSWRPFPVASRLNKACIEAGICILLASAASAISFLYGGMVLVLLFPGWLWRNVLTDGDEGADKWAGSVFRCGLTFLFVTFSWVFFRSSNMTAVYGMLQGMGAVDTLLYDSWSDLGRFGVVDVKSASHVLFVAGIIVWFAPDSDRVGAFLVKIGRWGALLVGLLLLFCLLRVGKPSEFLYFQF